MAEPAWLAVFFYRQTGFILKNFSAYSIMTELGDTEWGFFSSEWILVKHQAAAKWVTMLYFRKQGNRQFEFKLESKSWLASRNKHICSFQYPYYYNRVLGIKYSPSISTRSWLSVFSCSLCPPKLPLPLFLPTASISSMKRMQGAFLRARANKSLTLTKEQRMYQTVTNQTGL